MPVQDSVLDCSSNIWSSAKSVTTLMSTLLWFSARLGQMGVNALSLAS